MFNTHQEFTINAIAYTLTYDGISTKLYSGDLDRTLEYAATYFDRDSGDAYEGFYRANKYASVTVQTDPADGLGSVTLAVFTPRRTS